ncbi:hypothetical protein FB567DRAFT_518036 [Paraphoma chrysanthemicola]|uniref:Uncharacterized protein n=1 Tax=Paraphoma chrysanthemicola TaxID=798071 RepID=A0A8K0RC26_9PLEO|nr:hypothetical protein FB567DRAFT_518036 [Paraphoma chrysanthemicola]
MKKFATLLTITTTAYSLAFDGPLPTPVKDLVYVALDGFTPKPTFAPRALPDIFRRQKPANPAVCGYLDGDTDYPVSCTAGSCIYNTASKWFGCCPSGDPAQCSIMTKCINSASVSSCLENSSCYNDPAAMACTASSAPFCVNMFASIKEGAMSHWVCGASATSVGVLASATSDSVSAKATSVLKSKSAAASSDASVIRQGGVQSTGAAGGSVVATGGAAATGASATGAGARQTAGAMFGVAGGLVGVFAVFL